MRPMVIRARVAGGEPSRTPCTCSDSMIMSRAAVSGATVPKLGEFTFAPSTVYFASAPVVPARLIPAES